MPMVQLLAHKSHFYLLISVCIHVVSVPSGLDSAVFPHLAAEKAAKFSHVAVLSRPVAMDGCLAGSAV